MSIRSIIATTALLATGALGSEAIARQSRVDVVIGSDGSVSVNGTQVAPGRPNDQGRLIPPAMQQEPPTIPYGNVDDLPRVGHDVDAGERKSAPAPIVVRRGSNGHFVVALIVNGVAIRAAVDTGALSTFMTTRDAQATGAFRNVVDAVPAYGIAGSFMTTRVRLDEASVAGVDLKRPLVLVGPGINITLLGLPEISRLGRVVIEGNTMTITPRSRA